MTILIQVFLFPMSILQIFDNMNFYLLGHFLCFMILYFGFLHKQNPRGIRLMQWDDIDFRNGEAIYL